MKNQIHSLNSLCSWTLTWYQNKYDSDFFSIDYWSLFDLNHSSSSSSCLKLLHQVHRLDLNHLQILPVHTSFHPLIIRVPFLFLMCLTESDSMPGNVRWLLPWLLKTNLVLLMAQSINLLRPIQTTPIGFVLTPCVGLWRPLNKQASKFMIEIQPLHTYKHLILNVESI